MRSNRITHPSSQHGLLRLWPAVVMLVVSSVAMAGVVPRAAAAAPFRIDLRVLLLDDNSAWVDALESQMQVEGVPYTAVALGSPSRPVITDSYLSSGDRAFYQSVVAPSYLLTDLSEAERTALRAYEAKFGIREVDAYNWANPDVGLDYPAVTGDIDGTVASVTAAGRAGGFGYLNGPVPFSAGSWSYLAEPLPPASLPAGASYTTLVGALTPSGTTGSLIGVYHHGGVEQLIITAAFNFGLPQFKYVAHGIITWVTRGVHFGYNRNNFTFHADDAFNEVAVWDSVRNCTPGEDCPGDSTWVRMSPQDVDYAVAWQQANDYTLTLAFNAFYANPANDPLTQAFQANKDSFRWLNHGWEHLFQGCLQTAVLPWACVLDNGEIVWISQQTIFDEINNNIVSGDALGLSFDPTEYLSGEHSGLYLLPQQPVDNPYFGPALAQAGILRIGSDASRETGAREVGSAWTIPRHPTALYYNTATQEAAVDEYNWLYTSAANGGSGLCETTPGSCISPLDPEDGFTSYIVPTDAAYDLSFILSNDPRPFYAHTSNMTGDRLMYPLLEAILGTYRAAFTPATPLVNLTLTQASAELERQTDWAEDGSAAVTGYVQNGQITVTNSTGVPVPFTAPAGTDIAGATLEPYGGEVSGWLSPGSTTGTLPPTMLSITGSPVFVVGQSGAVGLSGGPGLPASTVSFTGSLPTGLSSMVTAGSATITGTPANGTEGSYPLDVTVISAASYRIEHIVVTVAVLPQFTSAASATAEVDTPFSFTVRASGSPLPTIAQSGALPTGIAFTAGANGTATLSGSASTAMADRTFSITFTATNSAGSSAQTFTLDVPPTSSLPPVPPPADHVPLTPARLADTRVGEPTVDGLFEGGGTRPAGSTLELLVAGRGGVATDAVAVALNVTAVDPVGGGFVTVYPCGSTQPNASNVNFSAGAVVPNAVIAKIGVDGKVCVFVSNETHLVVDVDAYFPTTSSLQSLNPARVLDTRAGYTTIDGLQQGDGTRQRGAVTEVQITGRATVPIGATAVVLNVTVTEADGPGFATVYPCGTDIPVASNLNYGTGSTLANLVIAKIGAEGKVCIFNSEATHLVADINGYFPATTSYRALEPARLLDTRSGYTTIDGQFVGDGIRPASTITELTVVGRGGVPAEAATVVLNVTVTESQLAGFVTVYPCGLNPPLASNLNYGIDTTVANAVIVKLGPAGKVCLLNSGPTHLVVDVNGYLLH